MTGLRQPNFWSGDGREDKYDVYDLKGLLEEFLAQFGMRGISWSQREGGGSLFLESGTVQLGKFQIGEFGILLPALARTYDLREQVLLAELNFEQLLSKRNPAKNFKALPTLPSVRRDVAMVVPDATSSRSNFTGGAPGETSNLETVVELFDVFRGKHVPAGQKSMAYAFTYRSPERSLTDAEVNSAHEKVVAKLKDTLGASVRE